MAEPPPPPSFPQRMPLLPLPLPQANSSPPKVPEALPTPKVSVAAARLPTAPPPAAALPQAEPPPPPVAALPQPRPPPPPFAALPQPPSPPVALPSSPRDHVARNPRIGDSGDVESGSGMSTPTVEALQEITLYVGAAAPMAQISKLHEVEGVADEGNSTSLSDICARMIQSCTYTVEVKVCGGGTANCEKISVKHEKRRRVARKLQGRLILPSVMNELTALQWALEARRVFLLTAPQ